MIENKKLWQKPELIVLVRTKPEESVLTICKKHGGGIPGPDYYDTDDGRVTTQYDKCNQGPTSPQVQCVDSSPS